MSDLSEDSDSRPQDQEPPDPAVTLESFREWRSPRFGKANPERMNNPVWEWLIRSKLNAFSAGERFNEPSAMDVGPGWCFDRFGQSSTVLTDGRTVLIAGEHEDYYDPDFYIYNDVVVRHPDGGIDIFGYPRNVFPQTDFHTATLIGNRVIVIGNLGYGEERKPGTTPVKVLDLDSFAISQMETSGTPPGWLHGHSATLSEDCTSIRITKGKLELGRDDKSLVENIDDWRLHLADWRWERLTDRKWQRWELARRDGKYNRLWQVRSVLFYRGVGWDKEFREQMDQLTQEHGIRPDLDIDLVATLYRPDIPHEEMPKVEDELGVFRIKVDGIIVRYVEDTFSIQMTVEGELAQQSIDALTSDLLAKITTLENTPWELRKL